MLPQQRRTFKVIGTTVGPYRVLEKLGEGGMGVVYLAEDSRLKRKVAIKSVSPRWAGHADARSRLLREARAAARLSHPNIVQLYDVVELSDGVHIVMEYLKGEPLSQRIRAGRIPVDRVLTIALDLCDALVEAHRCGIVHRDLKPGNIFLTPDEQVKVLDFGLSKVMSTGSGTGDSETISIDSFATKAGAIVGTPAYMAPEQLLRKPVDRRCDVYSLGVVLYEMLAGRVPFRAEDVLRLGMSILTEPAPSLTEMDPSLPLNLCAIVRRGMAKAPADRYQSVAELREALVELSDSPGVRKPADVVVPLNVEDPNPAQMVVAVLPLLNLTGDAENEYIGTGIADFLISSLGALSNATVISRYAVLEYREPDRDIARIVRDLGVTHVVDGSFQRAGNQLRVTLSLMNSQSSAIEWSRSFDGLMQQLFSIQRQLTDSVIDAFQMRIRNGPPSAAKDLPTANSEAFAEYAQARGLWERGDQTGNLERAEELLMSAIRREPRFVLAHAALGQIYWSTYRLTRVPIWITRALASLTEAMRIDPKDATVRQTLASVYRGTGQTGGAIEELRQCLAIQPSNDEAHRMLGEILSESGKNDAAIEEMKKAIELRPKYARNHRGLAAVYLRTGQYRKAIDSYAHAVRLQPDFSHGYQMLGSAYHLSGDLETALTNYDIANRLSPTASAYTNIGTILYSREQFPQALDAYRKASEMTPNNPIYRRNIGDVLLRMGQTEPAREAYANAVRLSEELLRMNPNDADAMSRLAVYEGKLERAEQSLYHIRRAMELNPSDIDIAYRKSVVYALIGQPEEAVANLRRVIGRGYSVTAVMHDDDFAGLRELPEFKALLQLNHNSDETGG